MCHQPLEPAAVRNAAVEGGLLQSIDMATLQDLDRPVWSTANGPVPAVLIHQIAHLKTMSGSSLTCNGRRTQPTEQGKSPYMNTVVEAACVEVFIILSDGCIAALGRLLTITPLVKYLPKEVAYMAK